MSVKNKPDFINELASMLPPQRAERAKIEADKEIFNIRLSQLREYMQVKQNEVKTFSQSSISRIESRKDIKVSTLIEYLENIGMGVEIKVYPKKKTQNKIKEITLLKA